ncbi:MAG: cardiolipin synthase [Pseudomonadota bacterium]
MQLLQALATFTATFREEILAILYLLLSLTCTAHILTHKRDTKAAIGWMGLAWLSPFLGSAIYFFLGINRIQRRAIKMEVGSAWPEGALSFAATSEEQLDAQQKASAHPELSAMNHLSEQLTERQLVPGNRIVPLIDGDQAFPAMLDAINGAQDSIALLSYIFDADEIGKVFLEALLGAQERGVEVRVLIDGVGSSYSNPNMLKLLKRAGISCASFLPTQLPRLPTYSNLRNHRKIMVVDGLIGFTGGTNIRQSHCLQMENDSYAQCLHFQLEGPVVTGLQRVFTIDWAFATGEVLTGDDWFPARERRGEVWARGVAHGPDEDFEKLADLLVGAVSVARRNIRICTPYFLPPTALMQGLGVAALRGVRVDVLVPQRSNIRVVQWATMAQLRPLVEKGCNIYLTPEPFDHTKLMIVDRAWSLIGSTNWDPRSLRLNFEFNVECYDTDLASELTGIFEGKRSAAERVTLESLVGRSRWVQLRDAMASLGSPYL